MLFSYAMIKSPYSLYPFLDVKDDAMNNIHDNFYPYSALMTYIFKDKASGNNLL